MAYLRNRAINLLNIHFGIQSLAMNAGGVFFAVFLLRAGALAATILFRAASTGSAPLAVLANACGAFVESLYIPTVMTAVYNQAKRSPCTLRFHIATEGAWDLGHAIACLITAALVAFGLPIEAGILLSLLGVVPQIVLVRRHYAEVAAAA
jgi:hypothetical protein